VRTNKKIFRERQENIGEVSRADSARKLSDHIYRWPFDTALDAFYTFIHDRVGDAVSSNDKRSRVPATAQSKIIYIHIV